VGLRNALADEDLERSTDDKTSAVHFLRFELDQTDITDFLSNDRVLVGVSHDEYTDEVVLSEATKDSLSKDLNTN